MLFGDLCMAVTQKDISKRAGVSIATVSLALRGDKRVLKLKRERIQELAREMGYVPNPFGRSLQANRSRLIGYLAPTLTSSFYDEVIQEISDFAGVKGYGVLLGVNINPEAYRRHLKLLREKRVDGIIAAYYPSQCVKDLLEVEQAGTPIVVCDFETFSPAVPKVQIDNRLAMEMVTEHLVGLGHKRFAYYRVVNDDSLERCRVCNEILSSHCLLYTSDAADE